MIYLHRREVKNQLALTQNENLELKKELEELRPKTKSNVKKKVATVPVAPVVVEPVKVELTPAPAPVTPKVIMSTKDIFKK